MAETAERDTIPRVLVVEDQPAQLHTLVGMIQDEGFDVSGCATAAEALELVRTTTFAAAVVDLRLPDMDGTQLLEKIQAIDGRVPVVINTAYGSFDSAKRAVNLGAFAYTEKAQDPKDLLKHVHAAIRWRLESYAKKLEAAVAAQTQELRRSNEELRIQIMERKQAHDALRESEARLAEAQRIADLGSFERTLPNAEIWWSDALYRLFGVDPSHFTPTAERFTELVATDDRAIFEQGFSHLLATGTALDIQFRASKAGGTTHHFRAIAKATTDADGNIVGYCGTVQDITKTRNAEESREQLTDQLRHAQKMEAVGTLATGVAHDFNNSLTAILGYAEVARMRLPSNSEADEALDGIVKASEQAGRVTRSLLTFSRKNVRERSPLDVNKLINETIEMLRHTLPAAIELTYDEPTSQAFWVEGDASQLQQVLVNLALNARDAMLNRGQIRITLRPSRPSLRETETPDRRRQMLSLTVADTGSGMSEEVRRRVFEPFYTTKSRTHGTGLGMAIAHGIISDHGGEIEIESVEGEGTRINILLPLCNPPHSSVRDSSWLNTADGTGQTILLADGNRQVRFLIAASLEAAGYRVVQASDGKEVVHILQTAQSRAALFIIDADLPNPNGMNTLEHISATNPKIPTILMCGGPKPAADKTRDNFTLLQKPFTMPELVRLVGCELAKESRAVGHDQYQDTAG